MNTRNVAIGRMYATSSLTTARRDGGASAEGVGGGAIVRVIRRGGRTVHTLVGQAFLPAIGPGTPGPIRARLDDSRGGVPPREADRNVCPTRVARRGSTLRQLFFD